MSNRAANLCIHALHDPDIRARIQVVGELVAIGKPAVQALIASLNDSDPEARWRAMVVLGWIGDSQAVEPLLTALCDTVWEVRQNAAWALGQIGDALAADALLEAMHDQDEQVCVLAAYALARMGDNRRLQNALHDGNELARRAASAGLSYLRNTAKT